MNKLPESMNFDEAVKDVIRFLDGYACEHYRYYGWHISDDEIFELPWINILINLRILITSHLGSMDRKKLDGMLHDLALSYDFDIAGLARAINECRCPFSFKNIDIKKQTEDEGPDSKAKKYT